MSKRENGRENGTENETEIWSERERKELEIRIYTYIRNNGLEAKGTHCRPKSAKAAMKDKM